MEIQQIQTDLENPDYQYRLKAIAALKDYDPQVAVPLLKSKIHDSEFLVRSFVAMGLGKQKTSESFAALIQIMKFDDTPNVRAEAANSLSLFGKVSVSHLVATFHQDDHWIVQRSIMGALVDMDSPQELLEVCQEALRGEDATVAEAAVDTIAVLANTTQRDAALSIILSLVNNNSWCMRMHVAYALKKFDVPESKEALRILREDSHHKVIAAALEDLLPQEN
ncbi:MAG: HEAT repeat domain-containing protein [Cyanobacteria bacterium P01_A01_bin.45]